MSFCWLILFLLFYPLTCGLALARMVFPNGKSAAFACFPIGFFAELALFQVVILPLTLFKVSFSVICTTFTVILSLGSILSIACLIKHPVRISFRFRLSGWEWLYAAVFFMLLCVQLYYAFRYEHTYMSYDDALYVSFASDAVHYNSVMAVDPCTGLAWKMRIHRLIQTFTFYPGLLSYFTRIPAATICRTVLQMFDIILAYSTYAYVSSVLFKKKEARLIFLILLSVAYIFGYYSHYSITFRLLGPNYQGKAIVATSLVPLYFALYAQNLTKPYNAKMGFCLLILSVAATGLSLFGSVILVMHCFLAVALSLLRRNRECGHLKYIPWACSIPALSCGLYFCYNYIRW